MILFKKDWFKSSLFKKIIPAFLFWLKFSICPLLYAILKFKHYAQSKVFFAHKPLQKNAKRMLQRRWCLKLGLKRISAKFTKIWLHSQILEKKTVSRNVILPRTKWKRWVLSQNWKFTLFPVFWTNIFPFLWENHMTVLICHFFISFTTSNMDGLREH